MTSQPKAKRRTFGRGYGVYRGDERRSHQHKELAKVVTKNATCATPSPDCSGPLEADHIVPYAMGGQSTLENLRPLCRYHNRRRGVETRDRKRK